jgi:hypothetical protein
MSTLALSEDAKASPVPHQACAFVLILPALAAIAYPWLLQAILWLLHLFQVAAPPGPAAITVTVLAILVSASVVMAVAFTRALALGRIGAGPAGPRLLAHPAFGAPSLPGVHIA